MFPALLFFMYYTKSQRLNRQYWNSIIQLACSLSDTDARQDREKHSTSVMSWFKAFILTVLELWMQARL